jgi:sarcosine oxidase subunit delta
MKLLSCPHLGARPLEEFVYGGPDRAAPDGDACSQAAWADYVFHRDGAPGPRREWWYHAPTGFWILLERDTGSDTVVGRARFGAAGAVAARTRAGRP